MKDAPTATREPPWFWGKRDPSWGVKVIFYARTADQLVILKRREGRDER